MKKNRFQKVAALIIVLFMLLPGTAAYANYFTVTPGVEYEKGPSQWGSRAQSIHTVAVDVGRPEVSVEALIPNPLNTKNPLTTVLKRESVNGHHVVAGINASFFNVSSGAPSYLLATNNIVNTYGVISSGNSEYMSVPSAFGIDREGKGRIGPFGYEATVTVPNGVKKINSINKERGTGETVLYTPSYSYSSTRSNNYGMELVLTNLSSSIEENYQLGKPITAKVEKVLAYGGRDSVIPKNGAVLSIQGGEQAAQFADVKVGSEITLSVDLTNPWKGAEFVLASGPLLVQNGKVDMTIDPNSSRANSRHPRTAVAVNADGSKVFLVTVDGRQSNSVGMTLSEFGSYLVSLGASAALNLDGGGSTTMAVRERGAEYPQLFNMPSDKFQRSVSSILGAVSYKEVGLAKTIEAKLTGPAVLLTGGTTSINVESALDESFHVVQVNKNEMKYSVTGDIGTISSTGIFTATKAGKGSIMVTYGNVTKSYPIEVLAAPNKIIISGSSEIGPGQNSQYNVRAYDVSGREMAFASSIVNWSTSASLGTISSTGILTTNESGKGSVTAEIGSKTASIPVSITSGGRLIHSFENGTDWIAESAKAETTLRFDGSQAPFKDGKTALTLSYDFTANKEGTSASYAKAKQPIAISSKPAALGLWVYGDGANHWLRGTVMDSSGKPHTIDFTKESELNWNGWKYVKASLPTAVSGPVYLTQIYIVETSSTKKNKGSIYVDRLVAEYGTAHQEPLFNDVANNYWAFDEIKGAIDGGWISGYTNGTFKPEQNISRAHAALLLSRVRNLELTGPNESFTDVPASHPYAREIAAVNKAGIMTGKGDGKTFDPEGTLTRAQMAKILAVSYNLTVGDAIIPPLTDVPSNHWALTDIQKLQANQITIVPDGKYKPNGLVTRAQFAAFVTRAQK